LASRSPITAVLFNDLGEYAKAFQEAELALAEALDVWISLSTLPELIEAATRTGQIARAAEALERLVLSTSVGDSDWGLAIQARSRALVSEGEEAESLPRGSDRAARPYPGCCARIWRVHTCCTGNGCAASTGGSTRPRSCEPRMKSSRRSGWRRSPIAPVQSFLPTGEKVRARCIEPRDDLTDQERQIAQLARAGLSNPEIGARLLLSHRTGRMASTEGVRQARDPLAPRTARRADGRRSRHRLSLAAAPEQEPTYIPALLNRGTAQARC
jgi:DNA-binding NarL/FixJ family response regulator